MPTFTIEMNNAKRVMLINFRRTDIDAILERIKAGAPHVDDNGVSKRISENEKKLNDWRSAFRPGDIFIFGGGVLIALILTAWWLLQKFWIG